MLYITLTVQWVVGDTTDEVNIPLALSTEEVARLSMIVKKLTWHEKSTVWLKLDHPIQVTEAGDAAVGLTGLFEELAKIQQALPEVVGQILVASLTVDKNLPQ